MAICAEDFRRTMGLFPGAVTLITCGSGSDRRGITATAVCSVSDSPPSLLACINRKTECCAAITEGARFAVQLLAEDDGEMAMTFAGARGLRGPDKFTVGAWSECRFGQPRLSTALASLSCRVASWSDSGSHRIFIGEIEDVALASGGALVYAGARFGRVLAAE